MEGLSKMEKGLMDMDNSAGGGVIRGLNGIRKNIIRTNFFLNTKKI